MRTLQATKGKTVMVDDDDFEELSKNRWSASCFGGCWYVMRGVLIGREDTPKGPKKKYRTILMHRQLLGFPEGDVDHIDHNGLNNQRSNLRVCTRTENMRNATKRKKATSIYKGVHWNKQHSKWACGIVVDGKLKSLGLFSDEKSAGLAYDKAAIAFFGDFAATNKSLLGKVVANA